ncbi:hypothetical protein CDD83_5620 [Cordyceps sp. RAO-2017]|nr:hypothetical protein CDD83_5620 [Cordyceps sp. RAO-2017]
MICCKSSILLYVLISLGWYIRGASPRESTGSTPLTMACKFKKVPRDGLNAVVFPINIAKANHSRGWFFAQAWSYGSIKNGAYVGLQPDLDGDDGHSRVRAVFSSFINGTKPTHKNCRNGADGGPGVTCNVNVEVSYSHTLRLNVSTSGGGKWTGKLVDFKTGRKWVVGEWILPSHFRGIGHMTTAFIEHWSSNTADYHECRQIPATEATFGFPYSPTNGERAEMWKPESHGNCGNYTKFIGKKTESGTEIRILGGSGSTTRRSVK